MKYGLVGCIKDVMVDALGECLKRERRRVREQEHQRDLRLPLSSPDLTLLSPVTAENVGFCPEQSCTNPATQCYNDFVFTCPITLEDANPTASCKCAAGFFGEDCRTVAGRFNGSASVEYRTTATMATRLLKVSLDVKTNTTNGILAFFSRQAGQTDFLAIFLSNGSVHIDFSLGTAVVALAAPTLVNDDVWHRIDVVISNNTGMIFIDSEFVSSAQGPASSNTFNYPAGSAIKIGEALTGELKNVVVGSLRILQAAYAGAPGTTAM
jgi:hypothetical protein